GKVVLILLLLLATTVVASADCEWNVTLEDYCCLSQTEGWFYNATSNWNYSSHYTALLQLNISGPNISEAEFDGYCIALGIDIRIGDNFNASIYPAEPTCKNNSIAYILDNWTQSCAASDCHNVSAAQSAIWYFWYIEEDVCSLKPEPLPYNHTALPNQTGWESRWIPNCTAQPEACAFINASINSSVPYNIDITQGSGSSFPAGTPIELEATVDYCAGEGGENVTVVFKTDTGNFSGSGNVYETETSNGIARATLICNASVESVTVTARVKDMQWFEIIDPCNGYQETFRFANITDDANFSFYSRKVPALSLPFIIFLVIMLSVIAISAIRRSRL
ncbi:MAG: hypothetical protein U9O85_06810, partial [Euryarchaeota archaeon]|nr:hypothetical protein [Euryarchaeota archaeon]